MNETGVRQLAKGVYYQGDFLQGRVVETHISWVILTRKFAFKIKKPVKHSFLDFSTLPLRKKYCEKELQLNSRFSGIYLAVLPVRKHGERWYLGGSAGEVADYAVQMKRMARTKEMDTLLRRGKVSSEQVRELAKTVASFHKKAEVITRPFDPEQARRLFNDIQNIQAFVVKKLGAEHAKRISVSITWSDAFLQAHSPHIQARIMQGFQRDLHGDLHSGNIFLYKRPVLFDCIEFNDSYRQMDVLSEVAFLCMDLESFGQQPLAETFLSAYTRDFPCMQTAADERLFLYYKCYRANIRAKIYALRAREAHKGEGRHHQYLEALKNYLSLMKIYMSQFENELI